MDLLILISFLIFCVIQSQCQKSLSPNVIGSGSSTLLTDEEIDLDTEPIYYPQSFPLPSSSIKGTKSETHVIHQPETEVIFIPGTQAPYVPDVKKPPIFFTSSTSSRPPFPPVIFTTPKLTTTTTKRPGFDDEYYKMKHNNTNIIAATDKLNSKITTNRTSAYLSCESGEMIVKINFSAPFRGVAYANYDRSSNCKLYGDGSKYYEMRIPLKGCGTKQEAPRLFINNIIIRFHRSLELEEDEIKTIICRYPPPLAPPPVDAVAPLTENFPVPVPPPMLSSIELVLIICALLFLTLLLLGIGCAYYCLKRRNIKIIKKIPMDMGYIQALKIPRATATETSEIPSDYPESEDGMRTIISDTSTLHHDSSAYQHSHFIPEPYPLDVEKSQSLSSLPIAVPAPKPITSKLYDTTYVTNQILTDENIHTITQSLVKAHTPLYTSRSIDGTYLHHSSSLDNYDLTTQSKLQKQSTSPPPAQPPAPQPSSLRGSIPDNDNWSASEILERAPSIAYAEQKPLISTKLLDDTYKGSDTLINIDETISDQRLIIRSPKILMKSIDDLYVTNISETITDESVNRHRLETKPLAIEWQPTKELLDVLSEKRDEHFSQMQRSSRISEKRSDFKTDESHYHHFLQSKRVDQMPPEPKADYQADRTDETYIESGSHYKSMKDYKSMSQVDLSTIDHEKMKEKSLNELRSKRSDISSYHQSTNIQSETQMKDVNISKITEDIFSQENPKFTVLFNILPPSLNPSYINKWRTTLVTDEVFRSLLIESSTEEEYTRISRDIKYEGMFPGNVWQVIIRVLSEIKEDKEGIVSSEKSTTEEDVSFVKSVRLLSNYPFAYKTAEESKSKVRPTGNGYVGSTKTIEREQGSSSFQSTGYKMETRSYISSQKKEGTKREARTSSSIKDSKYGFEREYYTRDGTSTIGDREEIKSITETDVYDQWLN